MLRISFLFVTFLFAHFAYAQEEIKKFIDWNSVITTDAFSDETSYYVATESTNKNGFNQKAVLSLILSTSNVSRKNINAIGMTFHGYNCGNESNDDRVKLLLRVDQNQVIDMNWNKYDSNDGAFSFSTPKEIILLIDQMFEGQQLLIRVFDERCGEKEDWAFSLQGLTSSHEYVLKNL